MEDMMLKCIDFICPYILFGLLLTIGLTVCAFVVAIIGAVVTTFIEVRKGVKGTFEHNRCYTLRGKK